MKCINWTVHSDPPLSKIMQLVICGTEKDPLTLKGHKGSSNVNCLKLKTLFC